MLQKTIFLNHIDLFPNAYLAKYLSTCVAGAASKREEETEEGEEVVVATKVVPETFYNIVGTVKDPKYEKPAYVKELFSKTMLMEETRKKFETCDVVICNIANDDDDTQLNAPLKIAELLHDQVIVSGDHKGFKIFILISSVLTWAKSHKQSQDGDLNEGDVRFRKAHADYYSHYRLERTIETFGKINRARLATYIVTPGLFYGEGESIFHYLFKLGFQNQNALPLLSRGNNVIPTIHIHDFAAILIGLIEKHPRITHLIATDDSKNTLKEITRAVSFAFTTGRYHAMGKEEALRLPDMKTVNYNALRVNLNMSSIYLNDLLKVKRKYESGLVANLPAIIQEFRLVRGLQPKRILLLGPPGSDKKSLASRLAHFYHLHHINIQNMIESKMNEMRSFISDYEDRKNARELMKEAREAALLAHQQALLLSEQEQQQEEVADLVAEEDDWDTIDEEMEERDIERVVEYEEQLQQMEEALEAGQLDENQIMQMMIAKLLSKTIDNQGCILEGYPKTKEQAEALFSESIDLDENEEGLPIGKVLKPIMPELVVLLRADDDDYLKQRAQEPDETTVQDNHDDEYSFIKRLGEYRLNNSIDKSVVDYFDEKQLNVVEIDLMKDSSPNYAATFNQMVLMLGPPRKYELNLEDEAMDKVAMLEMAERREETERSRLDYVEAEEAYARSRKQKEWNQKMADVEKEEREMLVAKSTPLRHYLMRFVMPTLVEAMATCCKVKPSDPVDYIAEYLLTNNPQVD